VIQFPVGISLAFAALFLLIPKVRGDASFNHYLRILTVHGDSQTDGASPFLRSFVFLT
jgi:hypothetical protein